MIIFRPGVASADDHVETWAEIEAIITATGGLLVVIVDDTFAAAIVPATADTECFGRTIFTTMAVVPGALLTIADGGRIRNPGVVQNGLIMIGAPTSTIPLFFDKPAFVMREGGVVQTNVGALVPMMDVQAPSFTLFTAEGSVLDNSNTPAVPALTIAAGGLLFWVLIDVFFPFLTATAIQGDASTSFTLVHDATSASVVQALFAGTFTETRITLTEALQPSAGLTAARPTTSFTGQTYFDTTLGIPIWWNGAVWVDATGAAV